MTTNVRSFLRDFAAFKARARRGDTVLVRDRTGEFSFSASNRRKSLLGAGKGRVAFHGDLAKPTLPDGAWKPSL